MKAYIAAIVVILGILTDWRPYLSAVQYTTAIRAKVKRALEFVLPSGEKQLAQRYRETFIRSANGSSHKLSERLDPVTGRAIGTECRRDTIHSRFGEAHGVPAQSVLMCGRNTGSLGNRL
jgi:hypothetical protein